MLTVFCVYWGDKYDKGYVYALKEAVEKNLSYEHRFVCITTERFEGVQTRNPFVPYYGWWQKIGLFAPTVATGPSLYFDLDVLITGSLDYLVEFTESKSTRSILSAPSNWARSGHGGIQASVMAWPGSWNTPFEVFKPQWPDVSKRLWGDQEFLTEILGDDWNSVPGVYSYKYHYKMRETKSGYDDKTGLPVDCSVLAFHGKPDPHEINDKCLLPFTATLHYHIKKTMGNGCQKVSSGMV